MRGIEPSGHRYKHMRLFSTCENVHNKKALQ